MVQSNKGERGQWERSEVDGRKGGRRRCSWVDRLDQPPLSHGTFPVAEPRQNPVTAWCSPHGEFLVYSPNNSILFNSILLFNMDMHSTAEQMERLELSEEDTEELWNSPSKRGTRTVKKKNPDDKKSKEPKPSHDNSTSFEREDAREAALREELQSVRNINQVIEGLLNSLDSAKGNMDVCYADP